MRKAKTGEIVHLRILPTKKNSLLHTEEDIQMYELLKKVYLDMPQQASARINSKHREDLFSLREWIISKTDRIKDTKKFAYKFFHRIVWVFNGLKDFPHCKTCGKKIGEFENFKCFSPFGYNEYCCRRCAATSEEVRRRQRASFMKKYGVKHQMQIPEVKAKVKESQKKFYQEKYGCDTFFSTKEFLNKRTANSLRKYGVKCPMKLKVVQERRRKTVRQRYGVDSVMNVREINLKRLQTTKLKYGSSHASFSRYLYDGLKFDSRWELCVWVYCKDHKIPIQREPVMLQFRCENEVHSYEPDFMINGSLVEVKGNQFFKKVRGRLVMIYPYDRQKIPKKRLRHLDEIARMKQQCMLENNVQIWMEQEIKHMIQYVIDMYGSEFFEQYKTRDTKKRVEDTISL